jgi:hypothetical protein
MKIKDLSSSNKVAGEGILRWKLRDVNGDSVHVELLGYHIPNAEVCLLSPQVLLQTIGCHTLQTVNSIGIVFDNGNNFGATFCPRSNLPMIPLALDSNTKESFWNMAYLVFPLIILVTSILSEISCIKQIQIYHRLKKGPSLAPTSIPRLSQEDSSYDAR